MSRLLRDRGRFYTRNTTPGQAVYGERLIRRGGKEFRAWSRSRSKLGAYVSGGGKAIPFERGATWLYLGAANGTTVSHVADLVDQGNVVAVEFSPRSVRDLVDVARGRPSITPVLADAADTAKAAVWTDGPVDVIYQDIAQRDQAQIFLRNLDAFLPSGAVAALAIKARSIDVAAKPKEIFTRVRRQVEDAGYAPLEAVDLAPVHKDHGFLVVRRA